MSRIWRRTQRNKKPLALLALGVFATLSSVGALAFIYMPAKPQLSAVALAARAEPEVVADRIQKSQYEITANDNGKSYLFPQGVHFSVFLDEENYPKSELSCSPGGIVAHARVMPVATLPLYAVRFDTVGAGSCRLHDKDFSMTIVVEDTAQ